jgi:hypothetical protein
MNNLDLLELAEKRHYSSLFAKSYYGGITSTVPFAFQAIKILFQKEACNWIL